MLLLLTYIRGLQTFLSGGHII